MVQHVQDGGSGAGAGLHQQAVQEMSLLEAHSVIRVLQRDMGRSELGAGQRLLGSCPDTYSLTSLHS